MDPVDLDQLLDRELTQLPAPRAPETLLPRVLASTVQEPDPSAAPTGWFAWPRTWQIGSAAALAAVLAAVVLLVVATPASVTSATRKASDAATLVRVFWDVLFQPVATYMFALGISLALACAAAWAALEVALGGASQR